MKKEVSRDRIYDYLYYDEAVLDCLRNGSDEEPKDLQIIIDYVKSVNDKLHNSKELKEDLIKDLMLCAEMIRAFKNFDDVDWTYELANDIYFNLFNGFSLDD